MALGGAVVLAVVLLLPSGVEETPGERAKITSREDSVAGWTPKPAPTAPNASAEPATKVSGPHNRPVPILMYHVTKAAPAGTPFPELWVSPKDFAGQMEWLAARGYTAVTMTRLFDYWDEGRALPKKPIVVSFDDGYPSHDKYARPVLAKRGWPGVLFVELNNVGSSETGFTSAMVRRLIAAGWEIGSHTITHPDLTTVGPGRLKAELQGSRARIKRTYGVDADFFCYPAGKYDDTVVAAVRRAGYRGATTVVEGLGRRDQPYELSRIRIDRSDGVDGFAAKLRRAEG